VQRGRNVRVEVFDQVLQHALLPGAPAVRQRRAGPAYWGLQQARYDDVDGARAQLQRVRTGRRRRRGDGRQVQAAAA
jgi:hypothetical protein